MTSPNPLRAYAAVTAAYWAFMLSDGALRMLVLLHFNSLGFTPVQLAWLFLLYEVAGIVTNLAAGWLAARFGLAATLYAGLGLQVVALIALAGLDPAWSIPASVTFVMAVQGLSGVAKDLAKMSSKSAVKLLAVFGYRAPGLSRVPLTPADGGGSARISMDVSSLVRLLTSQEERVEWARHLVLEAQQHLPDAHLRHLWTSVGREGWHAHRLRFPCMPRSTARRHSPSRTRDTRLRHPERWRAAPRPWQHPRALPQRAPAARTTRCQAGAGSSAVRQLCRSI